MTLANFARFLLATLGVFHGLRLRGSIGVSARLGVGQGGGSFTGPQRRAIFPLFSVKEIARGDSPVEFPCHFMGSGIGVFACLWVG